MKLSILVTGGAGYIGSVLVPDLLEAGHQVTVLDNFLYRQHSLNHVCYHPSLSIVRGDIRVESAIVPLINKADVIIPLAALVGAPLCNQDPIGAKSTNFAAIIMMLKKVSPNQLILMPTTNSAYGSGDSNHFCTEESPLRPVSSYAIDKVAVERELMHHVSAVSFRLATVFGMSPRMRLDLLVNDFTYRAVHDQYVVLFESQFKRNYIHVKDVSRVFQHTLSRTVEMRGQIYNVGLSEANLSKWELCEKIREQVPRFVFVDAPLGKDPDQRNYIVSNSKIANTGFKTEYTLSDGIKELVKGYQMIRQNALGNV